MNKNFYAPAKFRMSIPSGLTGVSGGIIFPSGIPSPTLVRRDLTSKYPHLKTRFLDPQLYLSGLQAVVCKKACSNLASYGWFLTKGIKAYESSKQDQKTWKRDTMANIHKIWSGNPPANKSDIARSIASCVVVQGTSLDCENVLLPSPLTHDLASDYSVELNWLDLGLATMKTIMPDKKAFATIALSDTCLRGIDPWNNDLLAIIVDQITSRNPDGAYIILEQSNEHGYFCSHPNTIGALLRLVYQLKEGGINNVIIGPCGMAGLLGISVGADGWSSGWYRGERRIKMTDYEDQMGMAVPTYYSHALAGDIHLEKDLDTLHHNGMLKSLADETSASKGLLQALRAGRKVASVPEWEHRKSNITAATEHFFLVAVRETQQLSGKSKKECLNYAYTWLKQAEGLASQLYSIGGFNPRTELNHQAAWLRSFDGFLTSTGEA